MYIVTVAHQPAGPTLGPQVLARLYSKRFRWLVLQLGVHASDLDDLVQDALLHAWENRGKIDPLRSVTGWLTRLGVNKAHDHVRHVRARRETLTPAEELDTEDERQDPEAHAIARRRSVVLLQILDEIAEDRRALFIECELRGHTVREAADRLGIGLGVAEKRLRLAWRDVDRAKARWQAAQRRRGWDTSPGMLLPFGACWRARLRATGLKAPAYAVLAGVILGNLVLPVTWSPFHPARHAATFAEAVPIIAPRASAPAGAPPETTASARAGAAPGPSFNEVTPAGDGGGEGDGDKDGDEERGLIERARIALVARSIAGDAEAHELLGRHAREFPDGRYAGDRDALLRQLLAPDRGSQRPYVR